MPTSFLRTKSILALFLLVSSVQAADFLVTSDASDPTNADQHFVVRIEDPTIIEEARNELTKTDSFKIISGYIVKAPADWNPGWSYHFDPATVFFGDFFIEVCDASARYVEEHLDEAGGAFLPNLQWCPWGTRVLEELAAPTPAPTQPVDQCFSGSAQVTAQNGSQIPMNKLELGDSILVADGKYEQIYAFGHYDPRGVADYLEISIPGASLEISPSHMVFTSDHYAIPASSLQVGDSVQTVDGHAAKIHSIRTVRRTGLYAPFTPSGVVVVNQVLASCFVGLDGDENSWRGIISYHAFAHLFETPHRMWCRLVSQCNAETYNELGISVWVARPHEVARWMLRQSVWIQTPLVLILLAVLVPLRLVEVALVASPLFCVMVLGMLVAGVALARRGTKLLHGTKLD